MRLLLALALSVSTSFLNAQVNCITTPDQLGPYFVSGTTIISNDTLMPGVLDSNRALELTFYLTYDCDTLDLMSLPDEFQMELWHADSAGEYSNVDGNPNSFNYRSKLNLTGESTTFHTGSLHHVKQNPQGNCRNSSRTREAFKTKTKESE